MDLKRDFAYYSEMERRVMKFVDATHEILEVCNTDTHKDIRLGIYPLSRRWS